MKHVPLFQPLTIGKLTLKNRIVMSPMTRQFSPGAVPTEDVADYYAKRAAGGAGLIVTEGTGVEDLAALDSDFIPVMYGDAALSGWKRVVDRVHAAGGRIFSQLWHQGPLRDARRSDHPQIAGLRPSGLWGPLGHHSFGQDYIEATRAHTKPMTQAEIAAIVTAFAEAARNAMAVGFDGIAIHGGHGYLIDSFLWEGTNRRSDRYGGSLLKRTNFAVEIVRAIRDVVGPGTPIMFRFSQHKQQDYWAKLAQTPSELAVVLGAIADAGVDIFDASTRDFDKPAFTGSDLNLAGWAKKLTGKLSSSVGGIGLSNRLEQMFAGEDTSAIDNLQRVLLRFQRGEFDLILVGRGMLADPEWANRLMFGLPPAPFDRSALGRLA